MDIFFRREKRFKEGEFIRAVLWLLAQVLVAGLMDRVLFGTLIFLVFYDRNENLRY